MSGSQGPWPQLPPDQWAAGPAVTREELDPVVRRLERYAAATSITPRPDLAARIAARLAQEPAETPPSRFVEALHRGDLSAMVRSVGQSAAAVLGQGRPSALVRAQALGVLLLVVVVMGSSATVGMVGASLVLSELTRPPAPDGQHVPPEPGLLTPSPLLTPSVTPRPSPEPTPRADERTTAPDRTRTDEPTATRRAREDAPETSRPRRTRRPSETREPEETRKPRETREPAETPEPGHEDDEPEDDEPEDGEPEDEEPEGE